MGCTPAPPQPHPAPLRGETPSESLRGPAPSRPRARPPSLSRWGSSSSSGRHRRCCRRCCCQSPDETSPRQRRLRRVTDEGRGRAPRVTHRVANGKAAAGAAGAGRGGGRGVADVGRAVGVRARECVRAGGARACWWPRGPAQRSVRARRGACGRARELATGLAPCATAPLDCRSDPGPGDVPANSSTHFARAAGASRGRAARDSSRLAIPREPAWPRLACVSPN